MKQDAASNLTRPAASRARGTSTSDGRLGALLGVLLAIGGAVAACADDDEMLLIGAGENERDGASTAPVFGTPDAGEDADAGPPPELLCAATECPPGWGTCPRNESPSRYACATDLSNDVFNCGKCGNACRLGPEQSGMSAHCLEGKCVFACRPLRADCNGDPADGCEVDFDPSTDPKNCGGCGIVCAPGQRCFGGACGCPAGFTDCGGSCRDLQNDDQYCGSCEHDCYAHQPDGGAEPAPNMIFGCIHGACTIPKCRFDNGFWRDCNGSVTATSLGDGCEIDLAARDELGNYNPDHCGSCGNKCAPGKTCFSTNKGVDCQCQPGETLCAPQRCSSLETDPANCGSCDYRCPSPVLVEDNARNGAVTCERARCSYACNEGFADCNQRLDDGCEANLAKDPQNCGGCGIACDVAAGQPCVRGLCVTKPCDDGGVTK